jgi:hypothetical protein
MYLFSKTATIHPDHVPAAVAFSLEAAAHASKITGQQIATWSTVYGGSLADIGWSMRVDSLAANGALWEKLEADRNYTTLIASARGYFTGQVEDSVSQIVAAHGDGSIGNYVQVTQAQCAAGRIAEAMAWGVDMSALVHKLTGLNVSMVRPLFGPWASVGWITNAESLADVDRGNDATASDPEYIERIDQGGELFITGSATSRLLRKIG